MSIEVECPGCQRRLSVEDQYAGKTARCPVCSSLYTVPSASGEDPSSEPVAKPEEALWRMKTPEGELYGPVNREEIQTWVAEGRVTGECQLLEGENGVWRPAAEVFPALQAEVTPVQTAPTSRYRYTSPNRGTLILVLGILSWAVGCPLFGIAAWVMGTNDLREMDTGRMDPSGRGLTRAGTTIGMIHALLTIAVAVIIVFVMLATFASR